MLAFDGFTSMYPQCSVHGEKFACPGSVISLPSLSWLRTGDPPGLCDHFMFASMRIQWKFESGLQRVRGVR